MTRTHLISSLIGLAVGVLALAIAEPNAPVPFSRWGIVLLHVVAAFPLAIGIAGYLPTGRGGIVVGLLTAVVTAIAGDLVGSILDEAGFGFFGRSVVRSVWSIALILPWLTVARQPTAFRPIELGVCTVIAFAVPAIYVERVAQSALRDLAESGRRGLSAKATAQCAELLSWGWTEMPRDDVTGAPARPLADLHARLTEEVLQLALIADAAPKGPDADSLKRGLACARLGRLPEAIRILEPIADRNADAELALATAYQTSGRYSDSSRLFARAAERARPVRLESVAQADRLRRAYEGLAYNDRMTRRFEDGAEHYHRAINELPGNDAYFQFQLALHYASGDRPAVAVGHFETAARLAPDQFGESARKHLNLIRRDTPACLILTPGARTGHGD